LDTELSTSRYELLRKIGAGGIGVVYEARDRERGALVALKTVQRASPRSIARFKREFRSVADVVHPNLVALYELVAEPKNLFFTMELIDGVNFLRRVRIPLEVAPSSVASMDATFSIAETTEATVQAGGIDRNGRREPIDRGVLDIHRLRACMRDMAEGVTAIHQAVMLHRDLKPSNVLVSREGRVVILDFGLVADIAAERRASLLEDRPLEGTASYMSPEQGARQALTPASDWYSVGVILYVCLTGRLPFVGGRDDILMDKQRFEPPPPHELAPDVPRDLSALCSELLRREPERRPRGADVLRRLGSDLLVTAAHSASGGSSQSSFDVLVGRDDELATLDRALAQVERGHAVLVNVHGPSGVGKTCLVRSFADDVGDRALVLRGRCYEQETVPFKAVDSIVDELARHLASLPGIEVEGLMPRDAELLARVFPVLKQVEAFTSHRRRRRIAPSPTEVRRRVFGALRELLARLADRRPIVIAIDDLQWGDSDSAALLSALLSGGEPPSLLLVCCYRSIERTENAFIEAFQQHIAGAATLPTDLQVEPLRAEDARRLARIHLGDVTDTTDEVERIALEADGSPFFVEELARHVRDRSAASGEISLDSVLRRRLGRLPNDAGRLLAAVSVAGRPIAQNVVSRAAGVDDPSVLSLLKAGSFVRTRQVRGVRYVEAYHDRVRETAVALLDDGLADMHRRLANALEAEPQPDHEALASHYHGAGDVERAAELALIAAEHAAEALAFDRAARLYRMALESDELHDRHTVRVALGTALANAGRGAESADVFLAAVHDGLSPAEVFALRREASWQLLSSGHIDRGLAALEDVLDAVGMRIPVSPGRVMTSIAWSRLALKLRGGLRFSEIPEPEVPASVLAKIDATFVVAEGLGAADLFRAADFHNRSLRLALKAGEPKRIVRAFAGETAFLSLIGVKAARRIDEITATMEALATRLDAPGCRALAIGARGMAAFNLGRFGPAFDDCLAAETIFRDECTGFHWETATAQLFQGFALAISGRVREMLARYPTLVRDAYDRSDLYSATTLRACLGFYVPLTSDDPDGALAEVDDAMAQWTTRGYHLQHANALNSRIYIDLYRGDGRRALQRCAREWKPLTRSLILRAQLMRALLNSTRARAAVLVCAHDGPQPELMRLIAKQARALQREGADYCRAEGLYLRAAGHKLRGNTERAAELLLESAHLALAAETVLNGHAALRAAGRLIGDDEGAAHMAKAEEYFRLQGLQNLDAIENMFAPGFLD